MTGTVVSTKNDGLGYLQAVAASSLWATLSILGKILFSLQADPLIVLAWRMVLAATVLGLILALTRPRLLAVQPRHLLLFAIYGAVGAVDYLLYFYTLQRTTVATAIILFYTSPALVTLLAALFFGEGLERVKLAALGLTLVGAFLVAGGYDPAVLRVNGPVVGLGLGAALMAAFYNLCARQAVGLYDPWTALFYAFIASALFLTLVSGPSVLDALAYPPRAWLAIGALALGPTLLAYGLFNQALTRLPASRASIVTTCELVISSLLAWVLLGEAMQGWQILGGGLVLVGVVLLRLKSEGGER
ncbi:MAG: DMT family transporter [Anaerolineae bacterium]|jgi:drug/metabolite transporter (DMT)-like permease|nr:DMT family transporter [Anaerolineae bacterium]MDH7472969.1 DMT family transporter [Anaerolineae bacterium]